MKLYSKFALVLFTLVLAACKPPAPTDESDPTADSPTPTPPQQQVIDFPEPTQPPVNNATTSALTETCDALTAKTAQLKSQIVDQIARNKDENALDFILGETCKFLDPIQLISELDSGEKLYYSELTQQFFATYTPKNTIAYVVKKAEPGTAPETYFANNRADFIAALDKAMAMMKGEDMDDEEDSEDEEEEEDGEDGEDDDSEDSEEAEDSEDEEDEQDDEDDDDESEAETSTGETEEAAGEDHGGWVDQVGDPGTYGDHVTGVVGNGMTSLLFFHAAWCPKCQANDAKLVTWYAENEFPVSTYKIDYDTADDLKQEFGVTGQDTFVLIDGNGNELKRVSFPTEDALKNLISEA